MVNEFKRSYIIQFLFISFLGLWYHLDIVTSAMDTQNKFDTRCNAGYSHHK